MGSEMWWSRVEGSKNPCLGYPRSSHDAHTMTRAILVDDSGSGSNIGFLPHNWHPPLVQMYPL